VITPFATDADIGRIVGANHHDPFEVLGLHPIWHDCSNRIVVRCFRPEAKAFEVLDAQSGASQGALVLRHDDGFFEGILPGAETTFGYRLRTTKHDGYQFTTNDPYIYTPILTQFDRRFTPESLR
jgi:1,4-alpha-glucan branching enzyme